MWQLFHFSKEEINQFCQYLNSYNVHIYINHNELKIKKTHSLPLNVNPNNIAVPWNELSICILLILFYLHMFIVTAQYRCELTPYSQWAHLNYLTVDSFWGHSVGSQWTHKMSSHCELAVSFPWDCNSNSELTACTAWWAHWDYLTNYSQQAHCVSCKLTENSKKGHSELSSEFTVR